MELILIFTTRDAGPNCTQPIMYRCFAMNNEIKHLRPILIAAGPTKYCGQDLKTRGRVDRQTRGGYLRGTAPGP